MKQKDIISKMSLLEKCLLMSGKDTWQTMDFEKYGIPSLFLSDGPHGVRRQAGAGDHLGLNASLPATCFPTAAAMANSWDESLGERLGEMLGEEAAVQGVNVVLGPGLNIKRSPLGGRNFEYFSEDPYLSGKMAAAYIRGIQRKGVGACPKHLAVNSQEHCRMTVDSVVDERTLREIYLTGFEIAVKEGRPAAVMSSYNPINGIYANENQKILVDILRGEWGFDGFVVSDWGGSNSHVEGVRNGSNLEMPSTGMTGARELVSAVKNGSLPEEILDMRADELVDTVLRLAKSFAAPNGKRSFDLEAHHRFAREAAAQSIVLLKNEDHILPLKKGSRVAVIGEFAEIPRYQGAGSSLVNAAKLDTVLGSIDESGLILGAYAPGYTRKGTDKGLLKNACQIAENVETVLFFAGLDENSESEGMDRSNLEMSPGMEEVLESISKVNKNVIVVLSAGGVIEMPWEKDVKAIVHGYLGGQAGASAMLDVLTGKVCPGGRLAETCPLYYGDTPAARYYPGKEKNSQYREGLFVGYRYYDTIEKPVRYPFGYGLSYTTFSYSDLRVSDQGISLTIKNTGAMDGPEVIQMYVGTDSSKVFRPRKELKGFCKVFLNAGEEKRVEIAFDEKTFRFYNPRSCRWETEQGTYHIYVGKNVKEILLTGDLFVKGIAPETPPAWEKLPDYRTGQVEDIPKEEFELLYGGPVDDGAWDRSAPLKANDTICQMVYAKSPLARLICRFLEKKKRKSEAEGKPDLNILFIWNMPFRAIGKMTGGAVNQEMTEGILKAVNGHFFAGLGMVIRGFFRNL